MKKGLLFCVIVFAFVLSGGKAWAATYTWTGGALDGKWSSNGNWFKTGGGSGHPVAGDDATVPFLSGFLSPTVDVASACTNLTITGTTTITLSANLAISGTLTMNSGISTGTFAATGSSSISCQNLTITAGTLAINRPITVTASTTMSSGTALTTGTAGAITGTTFTTAGSTVTLGAAASFTSVTINGNTTFGGGGPVFGGTSMNISNNYTVTVNTPVTINGAITVSNSGATIAGGTYTLSGTSFSTNGATNFNTPIFISGNMTFSNNQAHTSNTSGTISVGGDFQLNGSSTMATGAALSVTGNITTGSAITGTGSVTTGGNFTTSNVFTLSTSGAVTIGGITSVSGGKMTITNTLLFKSNSLTISGQTLLSSRPLDITNTLTASNNATIQTDQTVATFKAGSMALSSSTFTLVGVATISGVITVTANTNTFTNSAATSAGGVNLSGASILNFATVLSMPTGTINNSSGNNTFTNTSATSAQTLTVTSGNLQLGSSTVSNTAIALSGNSSNTSGNALNLYNASLATGGTMTFPGPVNVSSICSLTNSGTSNTISGILSLSAITPTLTFLGTGTTTISNTVNLSIQHAGLIIGSASSTLTTLNFAAGNTINCSASYTANGTYPIINYGKLNLNGTSSSLIAANFGSQNDVILNQNTGVLTATYATLTFAGSASGITNAGTCSLSNTTMNVSVQNDNITNTGTFTASAFTLNNTGNASQVTISNSSTGVFTAKGGSTLNLNSFGNGITNNGIFNAGASGSTESCVINLSGQGSSCFLSNSGSASQIAYFNLGPTSIINLSGNSNSSVSNAGSNSIFTLLSDATGSATIGQITSSGSPANTITGTFNVQRFLNGASTLYRNYRLMSSPVGIPTSTSNIGFNNINSTNVVYTSLTASTTYYGPFIAGPGSGFGGLPGNTIPNPSLYLYKESLNPSAATKNTTFTSGNNVGITQINSASVNTSVTTNGSTSTTTNTPVPVGNGYLLYFVGSTNGRADGKSTTAPPTDARLTNIGTINQQSITVNLWYTPSGGANKLSNTSGVSYPGYNMVGNPYASTIDLNLVYSQNSGSIGQTFYELYNVNPSNNYVGYNGSTGATSGTPASGASRHIASGQGFFVVASGTSSTLVFNESQKPTSTTTATFPATSLMTAPETSNKLTMLAANNSANTLVEAIKPTSLTGNSLTGLHLRMEKDNDTFDECGVYFRKDWSDKYEETDGRDLDGTAPTVFLSSYTSDGVRTCINSLAELGKRKTVKLFVKSTTSGAFSLKLGDIQNIDTTLYSVYIKDNYKKDSLDIGKNNGYAFSVNTADTTTFGGNRLELIIRRKPLPPYQLVLFTGKKVTDGIQLNWKTANEGNYTGFVVERQDGKKFAAVFTLQSDGSANYTFIDRNPLKGFNTYRLQQSDIDNVISYSDDVTISIPKPGNITNSLFTVYPNPTTQGLTVSVASDAITSTPGSTSYKLSIYNSAGLVMIQKSTTSSNWTEDVTKLKAGTYVVQLTDSNGKSIGTTKFIKIQ